MPIEVVTGRAGAGKTAYLCQKLIDTLKRNVAYYRKYKKIRKVYVNFPLSEKVAKRYVHFLGYWKDLEELIKLEDCDIFIDELLYYFDSARWKETTPDVKKFIAIHRHLGIEIYATSQDFAQVDIAFRRLTDQLYYLVKLGSSREPSATKPPVKHIWGLSVIYTISPVDYKEDQKENKTSFHWFFFLTRAKCEVYDTRQKFEHSDPPPKKHVLQRCELGDACDGGLGGKPWSKVIHI